MHCIGSSFFLSLQNIENSRNTQDAIPDMLLEAAYSMEVHSSDYFILFVQNFKDALIFLDERKYINTQKEMELWNNSKGFKMFVNRR